MKTTLRTVSLFLVLAAPAAAQGLPGFDAAGSSVAVSTMAVSTMSLLGTPMAIVGGPWVIGDVQFHGYKTASLYALKDKVRARRGALFTPSDVALDVEALKSMPVFVSVEAKLYATDEPVSENYRSIAASTMMARVVYRVEEKVIALPGLAAPASASTGTAPSKYPPASLSGVVLTPTAYRGIDQFNRPGLGLDINGGYFIGRLYGKNTLSIHQTNYIDRIGVLFLAADGKLQVQSESRVRPAMAVGGQCIFTFRDAPQSPVSQPGVTFNPSAKTNRALGETYFVVSKKMWKARTSLGASYGNAAERISLLTEFLSPQSLQFTQGGTTPIIPLSKNTFFGSVMFLPKPTQPLAVEFLKPVGMPLHPLLINFRLGYFLKLNFDISVLTFQGGWDLLGQFTFRYTHFPRTVPAGSLPGGA